MTVLRLRGAVARVAKLLATLFVVSVAAFGLLEITPGDPIDSLAPPNATEEARAQIAAANGLDRPIIERYGSWLGDAVQGDLGRSLQTQAKVWDEISSRLPVTLELAALSILVGLLVAVPVALYSGYRPGGLVDRVSGSLVSLTMSTPNFLLGILLVYVFAYTLGAFPALGYKPLSDGPAQHYSRLVLPVITLAAAQAVMFIRVLRNDVVTTLKQDYILSAKARGISTPKILVKHALRPSAFSLLTVFGLALGQLIGGTVIVESLFSIPGLGTLVINAITNRDVMMVQGIVLVVAVSYVVINAVVDLMYPLLDPRIRR
ncbi:ABC transporter permease [Rhodococcus chondri]|uniref:ABC transporter permease n=1 Tax=Rhodococcus chondri TaxID=3065941 RepID=A0ABU7JYD8_9NOCA|nr:ABC transporter permease [Rhodococcus sp. CC-R104]MEE2035021.1 ABC transporter permease [Rhodococcus sp. CC-R104]